MAHAGVKGYFGRPLVNGASNGERTVEAVMQALTEFSMDANCGKSNL